MQSISGTNHYLTSAEAQPNPRCQDSGGKSSQDQRMGDEEAERGLLLLFLTICVVWKEIKWEEKRHVNVYL